MSTVADYRAVAARQCQGMHARFPQEVPFSLRPYLGLSPPLTRMQVVVLPPYQRNGHGSRLLDAVSAYAESADALEVTVESPCEGMARLRDAHDAGRYANVAMMRVVISAPTCAQPSQLTPQSARCSRCKLTPLARVRKEPRSHQPRLAWRTDCSRRDRGDASGCCPCSPRA